MTCYLLLETYLDLVTNTPSKRFGVILCASRLLSSAG